LPLSQCANCWVRGGKRTAVDRRKKTRMMSRHRGQYWVERDKIVRNLLEGTRYR
ncbi:hypothetical protein T4B_336, partial [Trichinella pseudospiralis]